MFSNFKPSRSSPALLKSLEELQGEMNELTLGFVQIVIVLLLLSLLRSRFLGCHGTFPPPNL